MPEKKLANHFILYYPLGNEVHKSGNRAVATLANRCTTAGKNWAAGDTPCNKGEGTQKSARRKSSGFKIPRCGSVLSQDK